MPDAPSSRLTRRSLLAGGAAIVAGGAIAGFEERARLRRWGHALGVVGGPDRAIPKADASPVYGTFASDAMHRDVRFGIYVPPPPVRAVIVCLHGKSGDERTAFDDIGVHRFVAARGLPMAVAGVAGGGDSYWHARRDGTDAGRMVVDEFVPLARERTGANTVVLLGWSMGGYGALLAAGRRANTFAAVAVGSPALWERAGDTAPGAFDGADDFNRNTVFALVDPLSRLPVRIDCGTSDPFVSAVRAFLGRLPSATGVLRPGYHDNGFWRSVLPDQLDFFARRLPA